jgi:hypothetical protein
MKNSLLTIFCISLLSGCHMRCHDYINCHPDYGHKNQALTTTPTILKDANLTVRGAVYVEELY